MHPEYEFILLYPYMKKFILDLTVTENIRLNANYVLLKLTSQSLLPEMLPGQFAELRVDGSPTTFLRRPISINFVDKQRNEVWFLIQLVGDGTRRLAEVNPGETINVVLPLGNAYTMPLEASDKLLLVGGGVGTAPMLYLGEQLAKKGHKPTFLLGARSDKDLLQLEHKGVVLNLSAGTIEHGGKKEELTKNELKILHYLFRKPGEIVPRVEIIEYLWDNEAFIDDNTLSVNMTRIRGKLMEIGAEDFIETRRGMGYRI